ncbi:MAG TPA: DUF1592 domain-containing protein [Polyangia bacterium]|nr:DUF1592 domain-containing protein [Polyangia bacterium]
MRANTKLHTFRSLALCGLAAASLGFAACNGDIGEGGMSPGGPSSGNGGTTGGGATGGGPVSTGNPPPVGGNTGAGGTVALDSGRVSIDRLNNLEYDNTMRDLVGFTGNLAQSTFQPDEKGDFDNTADAFTINDARYEQYFNTADTIGEAVFADATLKAKILTCAPAAPVSTDACTRTIITNFGLKAWRRPLATAEVDRLVTLANEAATLGETPENSIKHVVKTLLASPQFLYRIEYDSNPASLTAHSLTPYELATRLSYLIWSSMPDDTLFQLAGSGQIVNDTNLTGQVDRMLADAKGATFTSSFAGQWLGARDMQSHQVEPTAFPKFDDALRAAMITEELDYFNEFLIGSQSFQKFFTYDVNFINTRLATHYGMTLPPGTGTGTAKVNNTADTRVGFMGLGSFLTFTSFSYRTAPTLRGKWVLLNLLCQTIPNPPANVPKLDAGGATDPGLQSQNVRVRLAAHRAAADCATCHATLDPIGLGLENFDAIGAYRTKYENGDTIDSSGVLPPPGNETFSTVAQLANILSAGTHLQQLTDCASEKMMTYALARSLTDADDPYLTQIRTTWAGQGYSLRPLLKDIVLNDTFRFRRGEM